MAFLQFNEPTSHRRRIRQRASRLRRKPVAREHGRSVLRGLAGFAIICVILQLTACQKPVRDPNPLTQKTAAEETSTNPDDQIGDHTDRKGGDDSDQASADTILNLFDGESLDGWEITNFGGEGDCRAENGVIIVEAGYPISGITSLREDLPTNNYEVSLDARKMDGIDFFCGLTFPVDETHCTFVVGGWAGAVVGLSCIDDEDASTNETRKLMKFEKEKWYHIKVSVRPDRIEASIDDEKVVDFESTGHKISLRNETLPSRPLGICTFETTSEFKNLKIRLLSPTDR